MAEFVFHSALKSHVFSWPVPEISADPGDSAKIRCPFRGFSIFPLSAGIPGFLFPGVVECS